MKNTVVFILFLTVLVMAQKDRQNDAMFPSPVSVTVGGDFPLAGTYPASIGERADQFLTRLFVQIKNTVAQKKLKSIPESVQQIETVDENGTVLPLRGIILKRKSGENISIDLLRFRNEGDFSQNPLLQHEDVIIFPFYNESTDFIEFSGAVTKPGKYQFIAGDTYKSLLYYAGGINSAYTNVTHYEVSRMSLDARSIQRDTFSISDDTKLLKGDKVTLLGGDDLRGAFTVELLGEFNEVKKLDIPRNGITFDEILKRAGGITSLGDRARIQIIKPSPYAAEYLLAEYGVDIKKNASAANRIYLDMIAHREKFSFYRLSNMTELDTGYFFVEQRLHALLNITTLDISTNGQVDLTTITAEPGDIIYIPQKEKYVYLMGQIRNDKKIPYVEGKNVAYYIKLAGGLTEYAEEEDAVIIRRDNKEWIPLSQFTGELAPGDYIYIPRDEPRSIFYYIGMTSTFLNIIGGVATLTLLVLQFTK